MKKPNVLILMTDQQRADCLSAAGHRIVRTPNMDRLAAEGVRFSRAYSSNPVCMPVRSSFHSGLYSHNHGQWINWGFLPPYIDTYPKSLKKAGYRTCHIGKSHLYPHSFPGVETFHCADMVPYMNALGWEEIHETTGPVATQKTESVLTDRWKGLGCLQTYRDDYVERLKVSPTGDTWPSPMPEGEHADDFVGRTAVEYLERQSGAQPFCLFVGFGGPHNPWDPPENWLAQYDPEQMDTWKRPTEPGPWVPEAAAAHQRSLQNPDRHAITEETNGRVRAAYYAKCEHADWWFGKILETLENRGLMDDTLIIFWSDHGEMLGDKGLYNKTYFYEESVHIPLVVRPPSDVDCARGSVCDRLVSILDVYPLIIDAAGCEPSEWRGFGSSLTPLLSNPLAPHNEAVFSESEYGGGARTMVRDDRYKMAVKSSGELLMLYDLRDDPDEEVNLAGKPGTEDIVLRMRGLLSDWLLRTQYHVVRETSSTSPETLARLGEAAGA